MKRITATAGNEEEYQDFDFVESVTITPSSIKGKPVNLSLSEAEKLLVENFQNMWDSLSRGCGKYASVIAMHQFLKDVRSRKPIRLTPDQTGLCANIFLDYIAPPLRSESKRPKFEYTLNETTSSNDLFLSTVRLPADTDCSFHQRKSSRAAKARMAENRKKLDKDSKTSSLANNSELIDYRRNFRDCIRFLWRECVPGFDEETPGRLALINSSLSDKCLHKHIEKIFSKLFHEIIFCGCNSINLTGKPHPIVIPEVHEIQSILAEILSSQKLYKKYSAKRQRTRDRINTPDRCFSSPAGNDNIVHICPKHDNYLSPTKEFSLNKSASEEEYDYEALFL